MHAAFVARGNQKDLDLMEEFLRTRMLPWAFTTKEGKKMSAAYTGLLQPIRFYSYVFPKEYKNEVLTALKFDAENTDRYVQNSFKTKMAIAAVRKAMRMKPVPKFDLIPVGNGIYMPLDAMKNIAITPIGVKDDVMLTDEQGKTYEAL